ncbi:MAG: aldo/keto reductase [Balneolaceae bacterium]
MNVSDMEYKTVGNSDLTISTVSFGCMSLNPDEGLNSERVIQRAVDQGINFFDTADLYDKGRNEEMLGKALRGRREEVVIATKVGNRWREDGTGWEWTPRKEYILSAVEESLKRLQTDRIDLLQLHGGTIDDPLDEVVEAFEALQKQGKIRYYGISSIRPNVIREYVRRSSIATVMMQYSLLDRRPEESCLELLRKAGVGVLARGTLAKGLLADKPAKEYLGYSEEEVKGLQEELLETGKPIAAALQFVRSHDAVSSAVAGIRTEKQLDEVLKSAQQSLSGERMDGITKRLSPRLYEKHR